MNIGIFGGSFDPVHKEHIRLAEAAIKGLSLDKLIVVPAGAPPHKPDKRLAPALDRFTMCKLAFAHLDKVEVSNFEILQQGTSYTYLTCHYFHKLYPNARLFWLVGTDMFWDFFSWKNPEEILSLASLAVCRRNEGVENIEKEQKAFYLRFARMFEVIPYNGAAVSSTEIRARVAMGMDISHLTPQGVVEYILDGGLYAIPPIVMGLKMEKPSRAEHSKRVCIMAAMNASKLKLDENKVLIAGALHDIAKNLPSNHPWLRDFVVPQNVPEPVVHQYAGAYVLERAFKVKDEEILNAVKYHTSGRENMCTLEKLIFLCDLLEEGRDFEGIEELRSAFNEDLDKCLYLSLKHQVAYLKKQGGKIYPLTMQAFKYYERQLKNRK